MQLYVRECSKAMLRKTYKKSHVFLGWKLLVSFQVIKKNY